VASYIEWKLQASTTTTYAHLVKNGLVVNGLIDPRSYVPRATVDVPQGNVAAWRAMIGRHPGYPGMTDSTTPVYVGLWKEGKDYALLTDGNETFINAPLSTGSIYFRSGNTTPDLLRLQGSDGNAFFKNAIFPSNQSTHSLTAGALSVSQNGLYTNGSLQAGQNLVSSDYYFGIRGAWLSSWLNQSVQTTAQPTFSIIHSTTNGNSGIALNRSDVAGGGYRSLMGLYDANHWGVFSAVTSAWPFLISLSTNNLAIGTTPTTSTRLSIHGSSGGNSSWGLSVKNSSGTTNFDVRDDGVCTYRTSMGLSDVRLKTNIRPLAAYWKDDPMAWDRVLMSLRPVAYDLRSGLKNQFGFIAQQVRGVVRELTDVSQDGMFTINHNGMIPFIVLKLQQIEQRLQALEGTNE
jgi:hypothetical protein